MKKLYFLYNELEQLEEIKFNAGLFSGSVAGIIISSVVLMFLSGNNWTEHENFIIANALIFIVSLISVFVTSLVGIVNQKFLTNFKYFKLIKEVKNKKQKFQNKFNEEANNIKNKIFKMKKLGFLTDNEKEKLIEINEKIENSSDALKCVNLLRKNDEFFESIEKRVKLLEYAENKKINISQVELENYF